MIRCGAFCFAADAEMAQGAAKSARRLHVAGAELKVLDLSRTKGAGGGKVLSFEYEGLGLPVVHGWLSKQGQGEYSLLSEKEGELEVSRDYCGTRPLYSGRSGGWLASDHRFFPQEAGHLLPRGAKLMVANGRVKAAERRKKRFEGTFDEAASELAALIRKSIGARVAGKRRVSVAFSGGLDSSIIAHCAARQAKVIACSVAAEGSVDSRGASDAAASLGVEFVGRKLEAKSAKKELLGLDLPFDASPMDRSLWCIYSTTSRLAAESGAEIIMLGQLADELFGGYAKYETILTGVGESAAERMMSDDVEKCASRGFIRDEAACRTLCEPRFPFAQRELAEFGESLPVSFKIRGGVRKAVLREAAILLGLPKEVAYRPKKAAQYSSGAMKLLG